MTLYGSPQYEVKGEDALHSCTHDLCSLLSSTSRLVDGSVLPRIFCWALDFWLCFAFRFYSHLQPKLQSLPDVHHASFCFLTPSVPPASVKTRPRQLPSSFSWKHIRILLYLLSSFFGPLSDLLWAALPRSISASCGSMLRVSRRWYAGNFPA